jgi:BD-FAE protein
VGRLVAGFPIMSADSTALTFHPLPADVPRPAAGAPAVIVMPGGGYAMLAPHEGKPVAEWLGRLGFAAWVLEYPVGPQDVHPAPLNSARAAMRRARAEAPGFGVDPARIGVLGFSAGGHLAAHLAAGPDTAEAHELGETGRTAGKLVLTVRRRPGGHRRAPSPLGRQAPSQCTSRSITPVRSSSPLPSARRRRINSK